MRSSNGNLVPNQFIIGTEEGSYFQSYESIIAFIPARYITMFNFDTNQQEFKNGHIILDENKWDYSKTTAKYRNQFLTESTTGTKKRIKSGYYQLANLN